MEAICERLTPIFREVFDNDAIVVSPAMTAAEVEEWDSLTHIRLMVAIEQAFGLRFSTAEISSFKNVGDLARCIEGKL
jgi:acyl carrier protein